MKNSAEAVIIGAGVIGSSTVYHLAGMGITDPIAFTRKVKPPPPEGSMNPYHPGYYAAT